MIQVYGLIVGIAVVLGWGIVERQAKLAGVTDQQFQSVALKIIVGGVIGARLWHIATDWQLYVSDPVTSLFIWRGGLSIFGAILGGVMGLRVGLRGGLGAGLRGESSISFWQWLDWLALALPFGQAFGRFANYFNQELYGWPSNLPWAITIDVSHRLPGFSEISRYHPLFLYEAMLLLILGWFFWRWRQGKIDFGVGRGVFGNWGKRLRNRDGSLFVVYLVGYCLMRICLDFFRLGIEPFWWVMGLNQVVLVGVLFATLGWWFKLRWAKLISIIWLVVVVTSYFLGQFSWPLSGGISDHSIQQIKINDQIYRVEVVNQPESLSLGLSGRAELGSDGMLFILPQRQATNFWMPDMNFALDILWIDQGEIVGITQEVLPEPPGKSRAELPLYSSPGEVEWVLEVNVGVAQRRGWQVGDKVELVNSTQLFSF